MCWSELTRYTTCGHFIRRNYDCPYQQDAYRSEPGWLSVCEMHQVPPGPDEIGQCGRCVARDGGSMGYDGPEYGRNGEQIHEFERSTLVTSEDDEVSDGETSTCTSDSSRSGTTTPPTPDSPPPKTPLLAQISFEEDTFSGLFERPVSPWCLSSPTKVRSSLSSPWPLREVSEPTSPESWSGLSSEAYAAPHLRMPHHSHSAPAEFRGVPLDLKNSLRTQRHREATKGYHIRVERNEKYVGDVFGVTRSEVREMRRRVLEQRVDMERDVVDGGDWDGHAMYSD